MDDVLPRILASRGLLDTHQLTELGLCQSDIAALVRRKVLQRVTKGYFVTPGARTHEAEHALLASAVARRGGAVLSHYSALATAGLPLVAVDWKLAHLTSRTAAKGWRGKDHVVHAADASTRDVDDVVGVAYALVQTGLVAGTRALVVAGDAALARGLTTREEVDAVARGYAHSRGIGRVRATIGCLDGRSESPGESLARHVILLLGYAVTPQVTVVTHGCTYRLDMVIDGTKVAIEFDGKSKYRGPDDLMAEKVREERLKAAGWYVVRFVWADLSNPELIRSRIEGALAWSRT